jgi:hypothetical protein
MTLNDYICSCLTPDSWAASEDVWGEAYEQFLDGVLRRVFGSHAYVYKLELSSGQLVSVYGPYPPEPQDLKHLNRGGGEKSIEDWKIHRGMLPPRTEVSEPALDIQFAHAVCERPISREGT